MAYKINMRGGSHPRLEDYHCESCGKDEIDVFFEKKESVTPTRACPHCGETSDHVLIGRRQNHIHSDHSSMYGKYEPGLGVVVKDYAHKQRVMKELGVMEGADPVGGSRCHIKDDPGPRKPHADSSWSD
jgi:DNA-directed RNA polymerase subunit RPC12/RpoP